MVTLFNNSFSIEIPCKDPKEYLFNLQKSICDVLSYGGVQRVQSTPIDTFGMPNKESDVYHIMCFLEGINEEIRTLCNKRKYPYEDKVCITVNGDAEGLNGLHIGLLRITKEFLNEMQTYNDSIEIILNLFLTLIPQWNQFEAMKNITPDEPIQYFGEPGLKTAA